ncbi:MAG: hypothetical protein R2864_07060 [Syntrophotaleaceae bacterium]
MENAYDGIFDGLTKDLKRSQIEGLEGYPPVCLGFLKEETIDSLSLFFRLAESSGVKINKSSINRYFLSAKKNKIWKRKRGNKGILKKCFF